MSEYGVTKDGFIRKRYDTIYAEMQGDIKDSLGIDISINPKSFFNVLISSIADKLATAWELAEMVYYNHYPATAEGIKRRRRKNKIQCSMHGNRWNSHSCRNADCVYYVATDILCYA